MKRLILPMLIILLVSSCIEGPDKGIKSTSQKDLRTDKEIEDLIAKNDSNLVFLSFWEGINKLDFKRVKNIETKNGNLEEGKFILQVPHIYSRIVFDKKVVSEASKNEIKYEGTKFSINISDKVIELRHEDSCCVDYNGQVSYPIYDGSSKIGEYETVIKYLIKLFDEKYVRIIDETKQKQYSWGKKLPKGRSIVIVLYPNYWYYYNNESHRFDEIHNKNYDKIFGTSTLYFGTDTINKHYCIASSNIRIRYEKYETYCKDMLTLKAKLKKEKEDKEAELKKEQEAKTNMLNTVKRNNNKL